MTLAKLPDADEYENCLSGISASVTHPRRPHRLHHLPLSFLPYGIANLMIKSVNRARPDLHRLDWSVYCLCHQRCSVGHRLCLQTRVPAPYVCLARCLISVPVNSKVSLSTSFKPFFNTSVYDDLIIKRTKLLNLL